MARRRSGADDPRLVQRIARYQARGLSANQALAAEKKAGRGMRRQAWLSLYGDVRERGITAGGAPVQRWAVKQPRGWIVFVVILTTGRDRSNQIDEHVVMLGPYKRKPSEAKAMRDARALLDRNRRSPSARGRRVVAMYVSSYADTVKREE